MIVSDLEHIEKQGVAAPGLVKALEFLRRAGVENLPDGKYEIDGDRVFAMVQRYETISPVAPEFEAHKKYIDVQFIVSGVEAIGWAPLRLMAPPGPYNEEKDICFGPVAEGRWLPLRLEAGQLAVLYPEDAHAPRLSAGIPCRVTKIVVKVSV